MGRNAQAMIKVAASNIPKALDGRRSFSNEASRMRPWDWLSLTLAFTVLASSNYWKVVGSAPLVLFTTFCAIYLLIEVQSRRRLLNFTWLGAISSLGALYLALSYFQMLPGKPVMYDQRYVFRMGYFVLIIYPITAFFYQIFTKLSNEEAGLNAAKLALVISLAMSLLLYFYPPIDGHWIVEGQDISFFGSVYSNLNYTLTNLAILFLFAVIQLSLRWRLFGLLLALFAVTSDSAQMNLVALIILAFSFSRNPCTLSKWISRSIIFGFPIAAIFMVVFADTVGIDPNTIHRAKWWTEALHATAQTGGIGLGFGADSTTDYIVEERFDQFGKWEQLPVHVIHNDIVYLFYALGLVGGAIFIYYLLWYLQPDNDRAWNARAASFFLVVLCVTLTVNSGLVSPSIFVGVCMLLGYLEAFRDRARPERTR